MPPYALLGQNTQKFDGKTHSLLRGTRTSLLLAAREEGLPTFFEGAVDQEKAAGKILPELQNARGE